jgi:ribosome maturation factor RimP
MKEDEQKIVSLIQPILERKNIFLLKLELRGTLNKQVLTIFLDTESGINMKDITDITREIEDLLDMYDPIPGHYRLEVSSPGTNWPITEPWQFRKNMNRKLTVKYSDSNGVKNITGQLLGVGEEGIKLQAEKEIIEIPLTKILKAVVKLNW